LWLAALYIQQTDRLVVVVVVTVACSCIKSQTDSAVPHQHHIRYLILIYASSCVFVNSRRRREVLRQQKGMSGGDVFF
jgi:hypothetical protein